MTHRSRSGGPQKIRKQKNAHSNGPRKLHHPPPPTTTNPTDTSTPLNLTLPTYLNTLSHSDILSLLRSSLQSALDSPDYIETVQKIKGLLYDRKWLQVFQNEGLLKAYTGRWVPSRAMCFRDLMGGLEEVRDVLGLNVGLDRKGNEGCKGDDEDEEEGDDEQKDEDEDEAKGYNDDNEDGDESEVEESNYGPEAFESTTRSRTRHILSIGGGAGSELLALSALLKSSLNQTTNTPTTLHTTALSSFSSPHFHWTGVDIGDWSSIITTLHQSIHSSWDLTSESLTVSYLQGDVLIPTATSTNPSHAGLPTYFSSNPLPDVTTIFFTLSELFSQSRSSALTFLTFLGTITPPGGLLLVVDSASDIAEFALGESGRKWPLYMVLDAVMVGPNAKGGKGWEKIQETDSKWWRLPQGVGRDWPSKLENIRYWMRLYRRV